MGKKGVNEKAEAARDRKAAGKAEAKAKADREAEDSYWRQQGEGSKSKAQSKREDAEKKKQEALAKKAEAKKLLEAEEASLTAKPASAKAKVSTGKVTQFQLQQQREFEARQREAEARERDLAKKRELAEEHYAALVDAGNSNRATDVVSASGVDEALSVLAVGDEPADKHPEKRAKAAWLAYQERMLPELRAEKPNLKMSQYKDMIWKLWQKAPENPMNQLPQ